MSAAIAANLASDSEEERASWPLRNKTVVAGNPAQNRYMRLLDHYELVFGLGPAGTGKTFLAVAKGIQLLQKGEVQRLIISRPAVEAGERLGFLPGDLKDKVDPYLRPIYDALNELVGPRETQRDLESGVIEVAPLAFMRGRTLKDAYVILDEAQNTSAMQMKMFLTRLGHRSRMVINGDLSQVDLPPQQISGLRDARNKLGGLEEIGVMQFSNADVMRHDLVAKILNAYEQHAEPRKAPAGEGA
jgi:phosphate starvation-inducible PhoH-like protein